MTLVAVLLFDGVEELDAVGPWEVFGAWAQRYDDGGRVVSAAPGPDLDVRGGKGLGLRADTTWDALEAPDVLVVPGGQGTRPLLGDETVRARLRAWREEVHLLLSVCTGALLLADAGLLAGRPAVTHHLSLDLLARLDPAVEVRAGERYVDSGDVVTAAG